MSFRATSWIEDLGFLGSFGVYAGVLAFTMLFIPLMYLKGKKIRQWTSGTVHKRRAELEKGKEGSFMEY